MFEYLFFSRNDWSLLWLDRSAFDTNFDDSDLIPPLSSRAWI